MYMAKCEITLRIVKKNSCDIVDLKLLRLYDDKYVR